MLPGLFGTATPYISDVLGEGLVSYLALISV